MFKNSLISNLTPICLLTCVIFGMTATVTVSGANDEIQFMGIRKPERTPLIPATLETLTTFRAEKAEKISRYEMVETDRGLVPEPSELASMISAIGALQRSYPVPVCKEYAYKTNQKVGTRFPYSIEANERLVDALDKLEENSGGILQWYLLHDRIIISEQPTMGKEDEIYIMDRPIRVTIEADLLEEAFIQVEAAYNKLYADLPFVIMPLEPYLMLQGHPDASDGGKFELQMEGSLREVILTLLDQLQDIDTLYGLSEIADMKGRRYYAFSLSKDFGSKLGPPMGPDTAERIIAMKERSEQRLEDYFSRIQH